MHIHQEIATSAIAILAGMDLSGKDKWDVVQNWSEAVIGGGYVEFYEQLAQVGVISATIMHEIADLGAMKFHGFPGVYAYEVDEELGAAIMAGMMAGTLNEELTHELVKRKLSELVWQFFSKQQGHEDFPGATIKNIIKKHTGVEVEE